MMAPRKARLTKAMLPSLVLGPGETDVVVWDDELPGFGLRLRAGGTRTWIVRYRVGYRSRVQKLGRVETVDPDAARKAARKILAARDLGEDPAAAKALARQRAAMTFGRVLEEYLSSHLEKLRPRSAAEVARHLRKHLAALHEMPLDDVTKLALDTEFRRIAKDSGPVAANRVRASANAFFGWAVFEGKATANPVMLTKPPGGEERSRERVLSLAELAEVWRATDGPGDFNAIVRLLILTGQRRAEVAGLRWHEIDFEAATWTLSGDRTKNSMPHLVPLSEPAVAILREMPVMPGREMLFGEGEGPFSGWSMAKKRLDSRLPKTMAPWTLHDIRRSVVTGLNDLGVQPHVVEALVNHVSGAAKAGIAGVYNRAAYLNEKRAAVALWADRLVAEIEGKERKVIPLRA